MNPKAAAAILIFIAAAFAALGQPGSVVNSPHNLSATGTGPVRAAFEQEICIFCHTPHNARPIRPLWNRATPVEAYTIYTSQSLEANPGQPTGTSKMCLSCHDGTIAVGSIFSRDMPIQMIGGVTTLPAGASNLGTELSDDHPISFRYDASLAQRKPTLKDPALIPHPLKLDSNQELQCTTCHDAHNNSIGKFLLMHNNNSQLCNACHQVGTTPIIEHQDCSACHQPHTAPSGPYLLRGRTTTETCLNCHDDNHGRGGRASNIAADLRKLFIHDTASPVDPIGREQEHSTCTDCHDPHTMGHGRAQAPLVHPNMGNIPGVSISGARVASARYEYETCFRCHAEGSIVAPIVPRAIVQNNTRLEFEPSAISFHPVATPARGRGDEVPSLRGIRTTGIADGASPGSMIHCSDCHGSDTSARAGGFGPSGVHGSNQRPLLVARYDTAQGIPESPQSYALCYQCHDRGSILADESFPAHRLHVVDHRTPCSACHDAHGIASAQGRPQNNTHLINFDTSIVFPDRITGRLEFIDRGRFTGECFLSCHNANHSGQSYQR
jgi:predicted CXXCH cytochrome family protein